MKKQATALFSVFFTVILTIGTAHSQTMSIRDVTFETAQAQATPPPPNGFPQLGSPPSTGNVQIDYLINVGVSIWNYVIQTKPTAKFETAKASIIPAGIKSWTELQGWSRPTSKIYRVEFFNALGRSSGSFDYRVTLVSGGSYKGKGKFIGQLSFMPENIKLKLDRDLNIKAQISEAFNFGTEEDPIAAVALTVTWDSPTTARYQMNSAEYFIYGTGEIQDLTHGN